jgi:protein ImuB
LFVPDSPDPEKLEVTIARLAGLVGNSNVGSPRLVDTHRPGEFRMSSFRPVSEESSFFRKSGNGKPPSSRNEKRELKSRQAAIAFRIFRPQPRANVESREGCPCRVWFRGMCGNIVAASGPWRTSGDWWEEHGWRQDEWDVEIHFDSSVRRQVSNVVADGLYRIYYDWVRRGWFVHGRYD